MENYISLPTAIGQAVLNLLKNKDSIDVSSISNDLAKDGSSTIRNEIILRVLTSKEKPAFDNRPRGKFEVRHTGDWTVAEWTIFEVTKVSWLLEQVVVKKTSYTSASDEEYTSEEHLSFDEFFDYETQDVILSYVDDWNKSQYNNNDVS